MVISFVFNKRLIIGGRTVISVCWTIFFWDQSNVRQIPRRFTPARELKGLRIDKIWNTLDLGQKLSEILTKIDRATIFFFPQRNGQCTAAVLSTRKNIVFVFEFHTESYIPYTKLIANLFTSAQEYFNHMQYIKWTNNLIHSTHSFYCHIYTKTNGYYLIS